MTTDEIAKSLLLDKTCENCKFNGKFTKSNYMQLPECHYWFQKDRKHTLAINPPALSEEGVCEMWEGIVVFR